MFSILTAAAVVATQPQPNCKDPQTQMEMNTCSSEAYKIADAAMSRQYNIVAARMKRMDAETEPGYFAALLESQRAWLKFRETQCSFEGYLVRGGTAEPLMVNGCLEQLTKKRTEDLKSLLEAFGS
jgi:uncharacterized protein YecT (DUF1311 family)